MWRFFFWTICLGLLDDLFGGLYVGLCEVNCADAQMQNALPVSNSWQGERPDIIWLPDAN